MEPMDFSYSDDHQWDQAGQIASEAYELYEKGRMTEALAKMSKAVDLNPACGAWHFNIGLTLDALERYEEAIECYEKALELCGEDIEILNSMAVDCTRTCQYDKALAIFEKIESIDPEYEPCYCNRIITYTEMEQHDKAEEMFYLAQQLNAECPICFYNIGNSLYSRSLFEKAIWCWKKTAELDPNHPQIYHRIAQACWVSGKHEEAREYFLKEIRREPGNVEITFDYGLFLLDINDYDAALEKFNLITELQSDFASAWFYRGEIMYSRGEFYKARQDYQRAIELDYEILGPNFRLAQLAMRNEHYEKAIEHLESELRLKPQDPDVLLSIGWMLAQLGEFDSAGRAFLDVLDQDRKNARASYGLGLCMAVRKNYDTALQFLKLAVSLDPQNPDSYLASIWLHIHTKDWKAVEEEMRTFRAMFFDNKRLRTVYRELKLRFVVEKWKEKLLVNPLVCRGLSRMPFLHKYFE